MGLMRSTGKPVEGHVEADSEEWAFHALANNGIITESLRPEARGGGVATRAETALRAESRAVNPLLPPIAPAPMALTPLAPVAPVPQPKPAAPAGTFQLPPSPTNGSQTFTQQPGVPAAPAPANGAAPGQVRTQFDNALEGALDGASSQIDFDALTERYRGKKVWVIDRDKIRRNVARVVDQALSQSMGKDENSTATRERVADAINELFKDTRNLTSQHTATNASLDKQIGRLAGVIKQFESALTMMQSAIRNIGSGGGGGYAPRRGRGQPAPGGNEQNAVLLEIFKTNLDLLRGMEEEMRAASDSSLDAVIAESGEPTGEPGDAGGAAPEAAEVGAQAGPAPEGAADSSETTEG